MSEIKEFLTFIGLALDLSGALIILVPDWSGIRRLVIMLMGLMNKLRRVPIVGSAFGKMSHPYRLEMAKRQLFDNGFRLYSNDPYVSDLQTAIEKGEDWTFPDTYDFFTESDYSIPGYDTSSVISFTIETEAIVNTDAGELPTDPILDNLTEYQNHLMFQAGAILLSVGFFLQMLTVADTALIFIYDIARESINSTRHTLENIYHQLSNVYVPR